MSRPPTHHADVQVHFICTERFAEDWNVTLQKFGTSATSPLLPARQRMGAKAGSILYFAERRSRLSEDDRAFVRRVLYSWDTELWEWACASKPARSGALNVPPADE